MRQVKASDLNIGDVYTHSKNETDPTYQWEVTEHTSPIYGEGYSVGCKSVGYGTRAHTPKDSMVYLVSSAEDDQSLGYHYIGRGFNSFDDAVAYMNRYDTQGYELISVASLAGERHYVTMRKAE